MLLDDFIKELISIDLIQEYLQKGYIKLSDYLTTLANIKNKNMSENLKITKERVKETIKKYPHSKEILEELFPEVKEKFYNIGMRFKETLYYNETSKEGNEVILAQTNAGKVNFINLKDGNRFFEEVSVQNVYKITKEELHELIDQDILKYNWELIT